MNINSEIEKYNNSIDSILNLIPDYLASVLIQADTENLIECIRFTAYRPYFNDGDRCNYSIYSYYDQLEFKLHNQEDFLEYYDFQTDSLESDYIKKVGKTFESLISVIPIEILEKGYEDSIFTVYKDYTEIEDYTDHD